MASSDGAPPAVRQRIDPALRREQILAIATRHFEQRPYSEVSTKAIATELGVGRPLIHYYFKTKRDLYLEVVRRFAFVPTHVPVVVVQGLSEDTLADRIDGSIEHWLSVIERHTSMWLATIGFETAPHDQEIQEIFELANAIAADRVLETLALEDHPQRMLLHTMIVTFGGLARAAVRQWLVQNTLSREQVHALLTQTLLTIVTDIVPRCAGPQNR